MSVSHAIERPADNDLSPTARWPGPVALQHGPEHHVHSVAPAAPQYYIPEPGRFTRFVVRLAERTPRWLGPASIAVCFAGAASYVWVMNPTDSNATTMETCLIKLTTGFDCPGCGGTRAFFYLMHGNVPEAVRHHAIAVFAAPFVVWLYLAWAIRTTTGRQIPVPRIGAKTASVFLAVWAVFMVVRNLPWAPFTSLYV
jgi:hypothetical protein